MSKDDFKQALGAAKGLIGSITEELTTAEAVAQQTGSDKISESSKSEITKWVAELQNNINTLKDNLYLLYGTSTIISPLLTCSN